MCRWAHPVGTLNGNHEYHGRVTSWKFSYSFGRFYYVNGRLRGDRVESRKSTLTTAWRCWNKKLFRKPEMISQNWETENCGRLSITSAMKNRDIPAPLMHRCRQSNFVIDWRIDVIDCFFLSRNSSKCLFLWNVIELFTWSVYPRKPNKNILQLNLTGSNNCHF